MLLLSAFLACMLMGYGIARLEIWMDNELPTQREIKRRMKNRPTAFINNHKKK